MQRTRRGVGQEGASGQLLAIPGSWGQDRLRLQATNPTPTLRLASRCKLPPPPLPLVLVELPSCKDGLPLRPHRVGLMLDRHFVCPERWPPPPGLAALAVWPRMYGPIAPAELAADNCTLWGGGVAAELDRLDQLEGRKTLVPTRH